MARDMRVEIEHNFKYHPPKDGQPQIYTTIRELAREFALYITETSPASPEQTLAIRKLEECVMWANAAIARNT